LAEKKYVLARLLGEAEKQIVGGRRGQVGRYWKNQLEKTA